jgi:hypothetical protein
MNIQRVNHISQATLALQGHFTAYTTLQRRSFEAMQRAFDSIAYFAVCCRQGVDQAGQVFNAKLAFYALLRPGKLHAVDMICEYGLCRHKGGMIVFLRPNVKNIPIPTTCSF